MAALLLRRELPRRATGLDEFLAPTESSGQGEQVKPPEVLMSHQKSIFKKGADFYGKKRKKGFNSLGINKLKLIREKQKKK